jgi:CRP-like cAMP-binding protein
MPVRANRLMEALSPEARKVLLSVARHVELPQHTSLYDADRRPAAVHFLTSGVASMVMSLSNGGSAEIGMIGTEGIVGGFSLLGAQVPVSACIMQVGGTGYRVPLQEMRRIFIESDETRGLLLQALQQQMLTLCQIAGCNKLHQATERLARWLLTAADRLDSDILGLTQESLSQMLGTRRTTVALVAGELRDKGAIRYRRGQVQIVNREALTHIACDCYAVTRRLVDNLYQ